ncbi:hypothetical protein E2C01_023086 [Portunus trituberculatus]|uniref:Alpha-carbonic anhydrase domain-containing protein n=1 Tax=Portunus trituberculatus TaxID=210409 RepID=A0A5B7E918_PORTR|nr:hypothetical protein [Portunus trituberculatus]
MAWNEYPQASGDFHDPTRHPARHLSDNVDDFFRYEDSLTTPPCSAVLVWTVFKGGVTMANTAAAVQTAGGLAWHSPATQLPTPAAAQRAANGGGGGGGVSPGTQP